MDDGRKNSGGKLEVESIYFLGPVSWLGAGMVRWCSYLLVILSQNPGMSSKSVDVRAQCHLGTGIDRMAVITLCTVQMDRKMSIVPAVMATPNPSGKDEWFPLL